MRVSLHTLGCKQNYAETSHIRRQFESAGHNIVEFGSECDALIINTCTVTENADTECRKVIRRALRTSPNAFVGVTGCYAQLQPEEIASVEGVDAVFGAQYKFRITELIKNFEKSDVARLYVDDVDNLDFVDAMFAENDSHTRAFLKIQDGCDYTCSFCTIPQARGASRSMNIRDLLKQIERLSDIGYREVVLTGINLGEYRSQDGERFVDVLESIKALTPKLRIRISSIEPNKLNEDILDCVSSSSIFCPHFHIPLQSGSDEILRKMRRRYTSHDYATLISNVRRRMPHAGIGADVICGFPGESDAHFRETCDFIEATDISYLHVFSYSERENTPAALYGSPVPMQLRRKRTRLLRELSLQKRDLFYTSQLGRDCTVIAEGREAEAGYWYGYSDNYVRVQFDAQSSLLKSVVRVQLLENRGDVVYAKVLEQLEPCFKSSYIPLIA